MTVFAVNGSARGGAGLTARFLGAFAEGLREGGAAVSSLTLADCSIEHCRSCFRCMASPSGACALADDMPYGALRASDALIAGAPLYVDSMPSRLKAFFDRCIASMKSAVYEDERGRARHPAAWRMPARFVLVSTCAFPEPENFDALERTLKAAAYNFGSALAASLCVPGALALSLDQERLGSRLALLREAGAAFARSGEVPGALAARINECAFTKSEYYERCREAEARLASRAAGKRA